MITKPMLKPMRGYVEVEVNGRRMYRNIKTGEIVEPSMARHTVNEPATDNKILNILLGVTENDE